MKGSFSDKAVIKHPKSDVQTQLEEAQALIRLQNDYIKHLEKGIEVMQGMHAYILVLEAKLLELGCDHVDFEPPREGS